MSFRWPVDTALYGNTCLVLDQMIRWFAIGCLEARQLSTFKGSQTWLRSVSLQVMVALVRSGGWMLYVAGDHDETTESCCSVRSGWMFLFQ